MVTHKGEWLRKHRAMGMIRYHCPACKFCTLSNRDATDHIKSQKHNRLNPDATTIVHIKLPERVSRESIKCV